MLQIGSIIQYQGKLWQVNNHARQYKVCSLIAADRVTSEVPDNLDQTPEVTVVCHPPSEWPFVAAPIKHAAGPVQRITIRRGARPSDLVPLEDWVPSGFFRPGGSIYFNPKLRLRQGEVLVATHESGALSRLTITKAFGTVARRVSVANYKPPEPVTVYDRLLEEDED